MEKNPQWPCYYNDLRGSTQDWTDEEFGAYVRLLIYHWDKGYIPGDEKRRAKISDSANQHWALLSGKFVPGENGNLINKKAVFIREKFEKHSAKQKENIAKRWNKNTNAIPNEYQTDYQNNTIQIPLENENEKEIDKENKEGGPGETISPEFVKGSGVLIVPEMLMIWKKAKPDYVANAQNDFAPLREIAQMIAATKNLTNITAIDSVEKIEKWFSEIVSFINTDAIYKDFQLSQVAKYFNAITSKMRSAATAKTTTGTGKKLNIINNNMNAASGARGILENKYGGQ